MATKEVRFDVYCHQCKNFEKSEKDDPCWDCLNQGWNEDSHQPIYYEADPTKLQEVRGNA